MITTMPSSGTTHHSVTLPYGPKAPATARHVAERWLEGSPARPVRAAEAVLIVSELVTNAVRHARGSCVLTLTVRETLLDIAVADRSEELPWTAREGPGDERGGFGFPLIRGLGGRIKVVPALGGKSLHVALDLENGGDGPDGPP
ncbi:ATP-binding protein [Streptomyces sp. bgisy095]|uniref:ATP-binding protein n=1 Tax=unclassified Streptomyces TaxID=2593676 RepID=UPI003D7500B5